MNFNRKYTVVSRTIPVFFIQIELFLALEVTVIRVFSKIGLIIN